MLGLKNFVVPTLIVFSAVSTGIFFATQQNSTKLTYTSSANLNAPSPTPLDFYVPKNTEVTNGEATLKLTMRANSFFISGEGFDGEKLIFTKKTESGEVLTLPDNSWSSSNQYVFVESTVNARTEYLVFKVSGENFRDGQQFLLVRTLFENQVKDYRFLDVTGWNAPALLIIRTLKEDGTRGPSYWFDADSETFLQLVSN